MCVRICDAGQFDMVGPSLFVFKFVLGTAFGAVLGPVFGFIFGPRFGGPVLALLIRHNKHGPIWFPFWVPFWDPFWDPF